MSAVRSPEKPKSRELSEVDIVDRKIRLRLRIAEDPPQNRSTPCMQRWVIVAIVLLALASLAAVYWWSSPTNNSSTELIAPTINVMSPPGSKEPERLTIQQINELEESPAFLKTKSDTSVPRAGGPKSTQEITEDTTNVLRNVKWAVGGKPASDATQTSMRAKRAQKSSALENAFQKRANAVYEGDTSLYRRELNCRSVQGKNKLRVLQFNVLAHGLSHSTCGFAPQYKDDAPNEVLEGMESTYLHSEEYRNVLFGKCVDTAEENPVELPIPPRFQRVLSVVLKENPDIITMQELDHFHDYMKPELKKLGYEGDFMNKKYKTTGKNARGPPKHNGGLRDGCAIFWNSQKLEQLGATTKIVLPAVTLRAPLPGEKTKDSSQVALYVLLRCKATQKIFAVCTAHMKSGNKAKDYALKLQHAMVMGGVTETLGLPVIYACDFNADPSTDAYKALRKEAPHLASAYEEYNGQEPAFASAKWRKGGSQPSKIGKQVVECIDFIFYSKGIWRCTGVLNIPAREKLGKLLLPDWKYPSDHFCIAADLEFE